MRIPKYTHENVVQAVSNSDSIRQVLSKLELKQAGGNYKSIKNLIEKLQLDISHFKGRGWNKNRIFGPKRPLDDYLSNKYPIISHRLRKRLIVENVFQHECHSCHNTKWMGEIIPLELDHIDGNHENNNLHNLKLLCPNCHALTPTYRGKNVKT